MAFLVDVVIPGPWWHSLTYKSEDSLSSGGRVMVPVGRGKRIGLCVGCREGHSDETLKEVVASVDRGPVVGDFFLKALLWTADHFLCGPGDLARSLLPRSFWKGEAYPLWQEQQQDAGRVETLYRYDDQERFNSFVDKLEGTPGGVLCLFPEALLAQQFFQHLKASPLKSRIIFWPRGTEAIDKAWCRALEQKDCIVVGGPGAAVAPLLAPQLCIVDHESSPAYVNHSFPHFSIRSFVARRFQEARGQLVFSGYMPSSRVFSNVKPRQEESFKKRVRFVSLYDARTHNLEGFKFPMALSEPVLSDTRALLSEKKTVLWLLDRRGTAGEIRCDECGQPLTCRQCEAVMTASSENMMTCRLCGYREALTDVCPHCRGALLQKLRPGLESLLPLAQALAGQSPVYLWHLDEPSRVSEAKARRSVLAEHGGLVLGSRKSLALLSELDVPLVCWLDADAEARQPDYQSRFTASSIMVESCCRGDSQNREVLLQTRQPRSGWQVALTSGWERFWERELKERCSLGFPPSSYMVQILPASVSQRRKLQDRLESVGLTALETPDAITVMTRNLTKLRRCIQPFFAIARSRDGFPRITLSLD